MALSETVIEKSKNRQNRHGGAGFMDREQAQQLAVIQNGLIRLYYSSEPIITGRRLRKLGKLRRRRVWRAIVAVLSQWEDL